MFKSTHLNTRMLCNVRCKRSGWKRSGGKPEDSFTSQSLAESTSINKSMKRPCQAQIQTAFEELKNMGIVFKGKTKDDNMIGKGGYGMVYTGDYPIQDDKGNTTYQPIVIKITLFARSQTVLKNIEELDDSFHKRIQNIYKQTNQNLRNVKEQQLFVEDVGFRSKANKRARSLKLSACLPFLRRSLSFLLAFLSSCFIRTNADDTL